MQGGVIQKYRGWREVVSRRGGEGAGKWYPEDEEKVQEKWYPEDEEEVQESGIQKMRRRCREVVSRR